MKQCNQCGTDTNNDKFCSHSCSATYNNLNGLIGRKNKEVRYCANCESRLTHKHVAYCSNQCKREHVIARWLNGENFTLVWGGCPQYIRDFLLEEVGHQCSQCKWDEIHPVTGIVPLEVDHIDGDNYNNLRENLRILCPNCHSLTPNFRNLNKVGGRKRGKKIRPEDR